MEVPPNRLATLTSLLLSAKEIRSLEGGIYHYSRGGNAGPISAEKFAHWLLAQARFRGPEAPYDELIGILESNSSEVQDIVPVWGVTPKAIIKLGANQLLVPIGEIPPSRLRDLLTGVRRHKFSFDVANSSPRPGAAIVTTEQHGPMFESTSSEAAKQTDRMSQLMLTVLMGPSEEAKRDAMSEMATLMNPKLVARSHPENIDAEELATVIALLTPKPIFPLGQWVQRTPYLPLVGPLGGWSGPTNEHPFYIAIEPQELPLDEIGALVDRYRQLDYALRKRLRTPLARLNDSRRKLEHHTVEAAAIDLGIALEALLSFDRDHNAPISHLVRFRGALLLAGSAQVRRDNYKVLKKAYDLRSRVVHDGSIADLREIAVSKQAQKEISEAREQVKAGHLVCVEILLTVIRAGKLPEWDDLLLGA